MPLLSSDAGAAVCNRGALTTAALQSVMSGPQPATACCAGRLCPYTGGVCCGSGEHCCPSGAACVPVQGTTAGTAPQFACALPLPNSVFARRMQPPRSCLCPATESCGINPDQPCDFPPMCPCNRPKCVPGKVCTPDWVVTPTPQQQAAAVAARAPSPTPATSTAVPSANAAAAPAKQPARRRSGRRLRRRRRRGAAIPKAGAVSANVVQLI